MSHSRNKIFAIIASVILVIAVIGGLVWGLSPDTSTQPVATPVPTLPPEPVNVIPVEERPYARLTPSVDGRTITVSLEAINKPAGEGEYEIEYQTGTVLQGAGGSLDIASLPDVKEILLGSCSAGGKCSYHEGVTGGLLTFRFEDPTRYAVRGEWSFWNNSAGSDDTLSSRDGKLGVTGAGFSRVRYGMVFQSPGYPAELPGQAASLIYALGTSTNPTGTVEVSLRLSEDVADAALAVWDGSDWSLIDGTVADKTLTATLRSWPEAVIAVVAE